MNRSFFALSLLASSTLTVGCVSGFDDAPADDVSDGEVVAPPAIDDLDGNGVSDAGNQSFAFGTSGFGATFIAFFSSTLPNGTATGVAMSLRGYGSEEYSDAEYGWATNFLPLAEATDSNGNVIGYGISALRDGDYEVNCARTDAAVGAQDGWCKPTAGLTAYDDSRFIVEIVNGDETCRRLDHNWGFNVSNGVVTPNYQSFAIPDESCY